MKCHGCKCMDCQRRIKQFCKPCHVGSCLVRICGLFTPTYTRVYVVEGFLN